MQELAGNGRAFSLHGIGRFVIMPNHVHGIIFIAVGARHAVPLQLSLESFGKPISGSIPTIVRSFKSVVSRDINELRQTPGASVWQRNYFEHIIRDEKSLTASAIYFR